MAIVTRHYGITGPVDFIDVELSTDSRLFLDPRAIRLQKGTFAAAANRCTESFFDEIVRCVRSGTSSDYDRGRELLQQFTEPKETRLGLSESGIDGHGSGEVIGGDIWHALSTDLDALVRVGILKLIEDVPVFVENVANDRTSDLVTRIIFEPLADFTRSMVAKHPEFTSNGNVTTTVPRQVWDPNTARWKDKNLTLPLAAGGPLVLVPRDWARPTLLMSSGRYFDTTMLSFAQEQRTVINQKTGKALYPTKDDLRKRQEFVRGVETIIRETLGAHELDEDLVARFRRFVDSRYEPISDDEITRRTTH